MPNKEDEAKGGCCSGAGCHCCCAGKAIKALVLVLLGGILGYFVGGHCAKGSCPMSHMTMNTPAEMPKK
jgi:hypothetical protein